jgi:hypothetical protein
MGLPPGKKRHLNTWDKHDRIYVEGKLDGSCVAEEVCKKLKPSG